MNVHNIQHASCRESAVNCLPSRGRTGAAILVVDSGAGVVVNRHVGAAAGRSTCEDVEADGVSLKKGGVWNNGTVHIFHLGTTTARERDLKRIAANAGKRPRHNCACYDADLG